MQIIHTIGTQGMNDEEFICQLQQHKVDAVIDIRLRNEGRWYRFASGRHIETLVQSRGIAYLHETQFAPTEGMLKQHRADGDWEAYKETYQELINTLDMLAVWREVAGQFSRPCLLCAEKSPEFCHRRLLAEYMARPNGAAFEHLIG